jgi:AraC family transcriptional regulator of adaptative response / DNA-3-methyladenine glycosylase II
MPLTRAAAIVALAQALEEKQLELRPGVDLDKTIQALKSLPGIGEWTAQYIAMRALRWPDAFPHADLGLMQALDERNPRKILAAAESWRPWRAYAAMHLWRSLEKK